MDKELVESTAEILHKPCQLVGDEYFADDSAQIRPIAALLIQKLYAYNALGISACQLGIDLSIFAVDVDNKLKICINPEIVAAIADMELGSEGCLSFPNMVLKVRRPASVIVRYKNIEGTDVTEELSGLEARAWLHEYDHTKGICFTDRVGKLKLSMAKKKQQKLERRKAA